MNMVEFRVTWTACPTAHNTQKVLFVKMDSDDAVFARNETSHPMTLMKANANKLATDHIERTHGISRFKIDSVEKAVSVPEGSVKEG